MNMPEKAPRCLMLGQDNRIDKLGSRSDFKNLRKLKA